VIRPSRVASADVRAGTFRENASRRGSKSPTTSPCCRPSVRTESADGGRRVLWASRRSRCLNRHHHHRLPRPESWSAWLRRRSCCLSRHCHSLHEKRASHRPFGAPGRHSSFTPGRVAIEDEDGKVLESLDQPRASFAGHALETWNTLQLAYFVGTAMWTYLTQPFTFAMPGFETSELGPWEEAGQRWRRLRVIWPSQLATHSTEQTLYFDDADHIARHDYDVEVRGARLPRISSLTTPRSPGSVSRRNAGSSPAIPTGSRSPSRSSSRWISVRSHSR